VEEVRCAEDVRGDDVPDLPEVLIEEGIAQAAPGIRDEHVDRSPGGRRNELIDAFRCGEIGFERRDIRGALLLPEQAGGILDGRS
jgi:hypothetical protein